eukprot:6370238-Alexandrium_andersonii.AAC.1
MCIRDSAWAVWLGPGTTAAWFCECPCPKKRPAPALASKGCSALTAKPSEAATSHLRPSSST